MSHDEIRELLEAYGLGVLDPAERALVEEHLPDCESCRTIAATYSRTADRLTEGLYAVAPSSPPPELRSRLLGRLPRWRWPVRISSVAVVLALALVVALSVWATQLNQTLATERAMYAQLAGQQEIVFEVVDSPKAKRVVLRSPLAGSTAYGKVFTRPDLPFVVAMAGRLPTPPPGQEYYLWLERDGRVILAGTLPITGQGFGALVYVDDRNGPAFQSARVTLQPPGVTAPDGVPALIWVP